MALGGAAGSVLRYTVGGWFQRQAAAGPAWLASLPVGTLFVNLTGSLLIGVVAGAVDARAIPGTGARLLLVVGLLGGYTTFSAFSLETLVLLRAGLPGTAALNALLQVLLGIGAAGAGFMAVRAL